MLCNLPAIFKLIAEDIAQPYMFSAMKTYDPWSRLEADLTVSNPPFRSTPKFVSDVLQCFTSLHQRKLK